MPHLVVEALRALEAAKAEAKVLALAADLLGDLEWMLDAESYYAELVPA